MSASRAESAGYLTKPLLAASMVTSVSLFTDPRFVAVLTMAGGTILKKGGAQAHEDAGDTRAEGPSS